MHRNHGFRQRALTACAMTLALLLASWTPVSAQTNVLSLTVTDTPDPVEPSARLAYGVGVTNRGAVPRDIELMLAYDPNVSFAVANVPPDAGTTDRWTFTGVAAGGNKQVRIEVDVGGAVPDGTVLSSTATATDLSSGGTVTRSITTTVRWCA